MSTRPFIRATRCQPHPRALTQQLPLPFTTRLLPAPVGGLFTPLAARTRWKGSTRTYSVAPRRIADPTFCSQKRETRSRALATVCKRRDFLAILRVTFPAVRRDWEQIRRILLLFCSRRRRPRPGTGMRG